MNGSEFDLRLTYARARLGPGAVPLAPVSGVGDDPPWWVSPERAKSAADLLRDAATWAQTDAGLPKARGALDAVVDALKGARDAAASAATDVGRTWAETWDALLKHAAEVQKAAAKGIGQGLGLSTGALLLLVAAVVAWKTR